MAVISIQPDGPAGHADAQGDAISFVLSLGRALHRYGTPAHRLEERCWSAAGGSACRPRCSPRQRRS